ncbi:MAG: ATP synthase F1 subunit gamma [Leptospiraceae bacterium]|nr:ATP synthase F1 subunit gamma [Leptospiraceae bacterium]MCP5494605.1 ATP synthase F1 subunit gamma [Leptospiraceae bacterium]
MATPREIKKRINSVKNTRKITRTMEMVSTAKSKKLSDRVNASKPFSEKIQELTSSLSDLSSQISSPYLRKPEVVHKIAMLVVTANRGLCGGYNSNILRLARSRIIEYQAKGVECDVYAVGKKGISFFKFTKQKIVQGFTNINEAAGYKEAEYFADLFMDLYANQAIDGLEVISTVYQSSSHQKPEIIKIFPIETKENTSKSMENVIYEPNPKEILESLLPFTIKTSLYRILLEALCSEQIARRIAMKSATDAAGEMIKILTRGYNRVRQAKITQEISEIVAGADSLKK